MAVSCVYILDSGILFTTWTQKAPTGTFITTSGVLDEIYNRQSKTRAETLLNLERLIEENPSRESIQVVKKKASKTGDAASLSETDIGLIALAYSKKTEGLSAVLVSTDMAVLNTARWMKIEILDPSGKFKDVIQWILKCPGCNHKVQSATRDLECPICGTRMRRVVQRKTRSG